MDSAVLCWMLGAMTGLAIGVACEAIAGACERRRQREAMADAEDAAYAEGLHDGRHGGRPVTLGPEVETDEA